MTEILQVAIVVEWALIFAGGITLAAMLFPWHAQDKVMAWHLFYGALVLAAQPLGFCLAGLSLWPAAIVEAGAVGVVYWRLWLLIETRRAAAARSTNGSGGNTPPGGSRPPPPDTGTTSG